ncbi:titin homolog isoform X2 [Neoarius graeffei]|nr:titin homolog isoform X2 [Neoarius graeffei]
MTSRKPMTHSYSGNGRYGSQNGDDVLSPRLDSRNYLSSVRPENRSTFCTVMSQLTEETQPCFETTIKSKAVSETCNVKFTCVVTGYPVPELTWYKDDMELDRYCGLPKYEIFRNGKIHTLHIYNCTVDDAAIYQASARNSKGIVSCSGVLEVGTMSEYKIHQRFFAKLKQKAELKRRELEHSYCQEKENIRQEQLSSSQNNVRWTDGQVPNSSTVQVGENNEEKEGEIIKEKPEALNEELNQLSVKVHRYPMRSDGSQENDSQHMGSDISQKNHNQQLIYGSEKAEIGSTTPSTKEKVSRNITISNGFDEAFTTQSIQGVDKDSHERMSLAKSLVESLQLKLGEEHQKTTLQSQELTSTKVSTIQEREMEMAVATEGEKMNAEGRHQEWGSCWEGEQERSWEKKQENVRQLEPKHIAATASEAKTPVCKEPEYQHKSALSSVFHSLKDIFFGKSKKSPETTDSSKKVSDINAENEILAVNTDAHCHLPQAQPQRHGTLSGDCGTMPNQLVPVEIDQQNQIGTLYVNKHFFQESPSLHIKTEMQNLNLDNHIHGFTTNYTKDIAQASKTHHDGIEEDKEVGPEALQKDNLLTIPEASDDHTEPNNDEQMVQVHHETAGQECTAPTDQKKEDGGEMQTLKEQDDTTDFTVISTASMPQLHRTDLESCPETQISMPDGQATLLGIRVDEDGIRVDEKIAECNLNQGSKDKMDVTKAESTDSTKKSETDTYVTERLTLSIYERGQQYNAISQDKSTPVFDVGQRESCIMESNITQNRNSTLVLNSFMKNVQGFATGSVGHDTSKVETISSVGNKDNTETKKADGFEKMEEKQDEIQEKKIDNEMEQRGDSKEESTNFMSEQGTEMSKFKKQPEIEGRETHLSVVEKTKIYTKVQPERHMIESRDQSVVSPIIILPDTRETVIKNVAKMRAMPFTPEIKVTVPEKVKHEELFSAPRIDTLLSEPERVIYHDDALIHRDNEPSSEELIDIASRAPNRNTRDDRVMIIAEPLDVTPPQHEKNVNWFPSDQRTRDVKPESLEAQMGDGEEPYNVNSGWNRGNDSNSIPLISIACADDITPFEGQGKENRKPVFHDTVHSDSTALKMQADSSSFIPTTHVEGSTENSIKKEIVPESLTVREVVGHFDSGANHNAYQVFEKAALQKEGTESRNLVETQLSSDVSSALSPKALQNTITCDTNVCPDKESKVEPDADKFQKDKPAMEKLGLTTPVGPTLPPLSPASLRRLMAKNNPNLETQGSTVTILGDGSERKGEDSGGSTPTSILSCENSPKMKRRDSLTLIPSATPEELASGARRKIYLAKTKSEDEVSDTQSKRDNPYMSPSQARRAAFLQLQSGQQAQHMEKRSPLLGRRKTTVEMHKPKEEPSEETNMSNTDSKPAEKEKLDPYKAPQVIRKIRGEPFSDALGHLKLWCQFFNVLSDSTIKWFKDDIEIAELKRSAGDESQVALAIVQASSRDCGVYGCTIKNEYGTDITDYLLSSDILAEFFLRDDTEVGEEIEMTPLLFSKGLVDPGYWGNKFFGRIMIEELQIGEGCTHKNSRAKVIYGLEPIFESGSTCIVKVRNQIAYGTKEENCLAEINLEITKQECKIHNAVREYGKIFAAEARVINEFGFTLEVIPLYLIYRPANTIPYATMEADLKGVYLKYCTMDNNGRLITQTTSEVEQKCCTFQHWIYQWTNGNLLVTQLEGVDTKITNVKIATKSKGYQSLTDEGAPKILEQFVIQHQCNYYCGLLGLKALTTIDSLQQSKLKTSRSPMLSRRAGLADSSSPQLQKKGSSSPQTAKKANCSPK